MGDAPKAVAITIGIVLLIVVVGFIEVHAQKSNHHSIEDWATSHGYKLAGKIEPKGFFESSPFWFVDEDQKVYKVLLADHDHQVKLSWFRFSMFSMDQAWQE